MFVLFDIEIAVQILIYRCDLVNNNFESNWENGWRIPIVFDIQLD